MRKVRHGEMETDQWQNKKVVKKFPIKKFKIDRSKYATLKVGISPPSENTER